MTDALWHAVDDLVSAGGGDARQVGPCRRHHRLLDRHAHAAAGRCVLRHQGRQPRRPRFRRRALQGRGRRRAGLKQPMRASSRRRCLAASCQTCWRRSRLSRVRRARARQPGPVIAVTGSVGKTGTKEPRCSRVLSRHGDDPCLRPSFNNHWGVPLTLARMPATARFAVFEIGMNHAGEIAPLADGAAACRDRHHRRAGASGALRLGRGDRRRQGGNLRRPGAGRHRRRQSRQSAVRAPGELHATPPARRIV